MSDRLLRWTLLEQCIPMLRAYARRLVRHEESAGEVLQEASLRILVSESPLDPERFSSWSRGVVRNVALREFRRKRMREAELDEHLQQVQIADSTDLERTAATWQTLARATSGLPLDDHLLLFRRYILEETPTELADGCERSAAALRMQLMRLRATLRQGVA